MRRLLLSTFVLLFAIVSRAGATPPPCPTNVSPTPTSCWTYNETTGTTAFDSVSSNDGTYQGAFTLTGNGVQMNAAGQVQQPPANSGGAIVSTAQQINQSNAVTVVISFAGTGGGLLQFSNTSQASASQQNLVLYLSSFGTGIWGVYNFGLEPIVQSLQPGFQANGITGVNYADGNPHVMVASVGPAGMKLYADGVAIGTNPNTQANGSPGYWTVGAANTTFWPASPANINFNGTVYYAAVWQGTQLTDAQALAVSGYTVPTPNNIPLCNIFGNIAALAQNLGFTYANQNIVFTTNPGPQLPNGVGAQIIAPTSVTIQTDASGNLPAGFSLPQGAHVMMSIGSGTMPSRQIPLTVPLQASIELAGLVLAEVDPPQVVSSVAVQGPLFAGSSVQNPAPGQIGPSTIVSPNSVPLTCGSACTVAPSSGPVQSVTITANSAIQLCGQVDGQQFSVDTIENSTGGWVPVFSVCSPFTLAWNNGNGAVQPPMGSTAAGAHQVWNFIVEGAVVVGSLGSVPTAGSFPLTSDVSANDFSIINLGGLSLNQQPPPSNVVPTATCSGTCATVYTYDVTCATGTGETTGTQVTATNASSLSSSNFNTLTWTFQSACTTGYYIYGRVSGSLNRLALVPTGTTTYQDTGTAAGGAVYTITFSNPANDPSGVMWDVTGNAAVWFDTAANNSGSATTATVHAVAPVVTTSQTHDTLFTVYGYYPGTPTATPTPMSNVQNLPALANQNAIWGGTNDIASSGTVASKTLGIHNTGVVSTTVVNWVATSLAIMSSNTGSAITVNGGQTMAASAPFTSLTFTDVVGASTGDLEIGCVSYTGNIQTMTGGVSQLYTVTNTNGLKLTCFYAVPITAYQPPLFNSTGSITQNTLAYGVWHEYLLAPIVWSPESMDLGNSAAIQGSFSMPVPLTVFSCRATWTVWAGCSPFPTYAIKDITSGNVLCSTGTVSGTATDESITPSHYTAAAGDLLEFLATSVGTSCSAGAARMTMVLHQ